jgi:hypothetical protein
VLAVFLSQYFSVALRITFSPLSLHERITIFVEYPANMNIQSNNKIKLIRSIWIVTIVVTTGAAFLMPTSTAALPSPFAQGVESSFGILAGTEVTNTGPSQIVGSAGSNIGVSTGSSIGGGISIGTGVLHSNDAEAIAAKSAMGVTNAILAGILISLLGGSSLLLRKGTQK